MSTAAETILTNAEIVLEDRAFRGTLVLRGRDIAEVSEGISNLPSACDLGGDVLMPGVVDLHTDNLERQVMPRANARWPSRSAFLSHDAQCAAAGVTTVLDALCVGDLGFDQGRDQTFREGVEDMTALAPTGLLKADHLLHLRCEVPAPDMPGILDTVADHPLVAMVSLMDHSPGVGQYRDLERYRAMRMRMTRLTLDETNARILHLQEQRNRLFDTQRRYVLGRVGHRHLPLASHDDESAEQVARNARDGIRISEFPVTMEAAVAAKGIGVGVIAGAPNIVRGGSHSGNIAAEALVREGAVDVLASDYVPPALIEAAFRIAAILGLPAAIATVTAAPARMCRLDDRGTLEPGKRADVVRVHRLGELPMVRQVWRAGERVA